MPFLKFVILIGHGGVPADCPAELAGEFKRLQSAAKGMPSPRAAEIEARLRSWPRTEKNDPYKAGLEAVAATLADALPEHRVLAAYNEFCSPTLEQAVEEAVKENACQITVISTMYTRGGIHSEAEIPAELKELRRKHPKVDIRYVWPFDLKAVAGLLAREVRRTEG